MAEQDKTKLGTRVRYITNDGRLTQTGTVIQPVATPGYGRVTCDCGIDRNDPIHDDVWVKWDNGTKSIVATCHLTTRKDLIDHE